MCAQTENSVEEDRVRGYSKLLDEHRDELEGLPYQGAFDFMAGEGDEPESREGDERAVWQLIEDGDLSGEQFEKAKEIVDQYPFLDVESMKSERRRQEMYASLFDEPIRFDKYDVRFAKDLIKKINNGKLISQQQFKYLQYFVYRYREQIKDTVIYEEDASDRCYELLGDDPRESLDKIFEESKRRYEEVNPRQ